jgi:hypothetical protein
MALTERMSMGSMSQDRRTRENRNHTQVTSFGVCAAREEPLLEHILIRAIRKCADGNPFCNAVSTHAEHVQRGGDIRVSGRPVSVDQLAGNRSPYNVRLAAYMISITPSTAV